MFIRMVVVPGEVVRLGANKLKLGNVKREIGRCLQLLCSYHSIFLILKRGKLSLGGQYKK